VVVVDNYYMGLSLMVLALLLLMVLMVLMVVFDLT
jgi:hypothetical protein